MASATVSHCWRGLHVCRLWRWGPFLPVLQTGPRELPPACRLGGQEEARTADTVKSAGFTQLGFVIWQTVKYLPYLSVSAAAAMAHRVMKYPVKFWQFRRCGNPGSCKGPVGALRQRPCARPAGRPGGRRRAPFTVDICVNSAQ